MTLARLLSAAAATALGLATLAVSSPAHADNTTVGHSERTADGYSIVVDVPLGVDVDLSGVTVTVDGQSFGATATPAADQSAVQRTAVLAIDTSDSMSGAKFTAAKAAASTFLQTVPADVSVGIVTFDSGVDDVLAPTRDRAQAAQVLAGLSLGRGTRLYDGVLGAITAAGGTGPRTVLVLSDGADTSSDSSLQNVATAVRRADVSVDVVALDRSPRSLDALRTLAAGGQVVGSDASALTEAFAAEAGVLQRQVAVSVDVPADAAAAQAARTVSIRVDLPTATGAIDAAVAVPPSATAPSDTGISPPTIAAESGLDAPHWVLVLGVAVFAGGLLVGLILLVPARARQMSAEDRVLSYAAIGREPTGADGAGKDTEDALAPARQAVEKVLRRNRGLDERIAARLDAAGSELKSPEWLLLHAGIFVGSAVLGLLLGRGNLLIGLLFMILGAVGPWFYLGRRRSRRRKAFNAVLPDTLQLMSGSLSAGLSLAQSVDTIVREGAEPIASEFRRVLIETRLGVALEDAFEGVAERFESQDFGWVVMSIRIQRQVGGNLAELLDTVGATMREREYMRRQVAALAAEGKLSAIVLGGLPPAFLLYLVVANGAYVKPLFTEPMGWAMLAGAAMLLGVGIFWMSRLIKVEV